MEERIRETFALHSTTEEYRERIDNAKDIVKKSLKKYNKSYVAFSGGKDSTVMLHMIIEQQKDIMVLHWDYGKYYMPRVYFNEIMENAKKIGVENLRVETSELYDKLKRKATNVIGMDLIKGLIPRLIKEGYDCCFVGLRKEESIKRRLRITSGRSLTEMKEVFPIRDLTWLDVWGYIVENGIPYISYYDKYSPVVGWDKVRFTTLFDPEFLAYGCPEIDNVLSWKLRYF